MRKSTLLPISLGMTALLTVLGFFTASRVSSSGAEFTNDLSTRDLIDPHTSILGATSALTITPQPETYFFLPLVLEPQVLEPVELSEAWVTDSEGDERIAFTSGESMQFLARGSNNTSLPTSVLLTWTLTGPISTTLVYSETFVLDPGPWEHAFPTTAPAEQGIYTPTVKIKQAIQASSISAQFIVNPSSGIVISDDQGFDACFLPTVAEMQTWWDKSPYRVVNIYLGGVSFFSGCTRISSNWLHSVAQQGWSFIPTWVGPQAPCSIFTHRMSSNATKAYRQGKEEAEDAARAATDLGLSGEKIIYYDVEVYSTASSACRDVVKSFVNGWVERLHELGFKAGAYGAACGSYLSDWATISSPPDDVWIAHWYRSSYDPDASVWGTPCLPDTLWVNHQRIKQYAGDHYETWGGVRRAIDSNVLDGEIVAMPFSEGMAVDPSRSETRHPALTQIHKMGLLSPLDGWILQGDQLLWTSDGGTRWQVIFPEPERPDKILAVSFLDTKIGWVIQRPIPSAGVTVSRTSDGGATWQSTPLHAATDETLFGVGDAFLEFIDNQTGWLVLKRQTSSNFSLGSLFFTQDGGKTWEQRSLPLGEPVRFIDTDQGWIAGGPDGSQLFWSQDGGVSWRPQHLALPQLIAPEQVSIGLPAFDAQGNGFLPVTVTDPSGTQMVLYMLDRDGATWVPTHRENNLAPRNNGPIPFDLTGGGHWWAVPFEGHRMLSGAGPGTPLQQHAAQGLPGGVLSLEFTNDEVGWALAQEGICNGAKTPTGHGSSTGLEEIRCSRGSYLYKTVDGGRSWTLIPLIGNTVQLITP